MAVEAPKPLDPKVKDFNPEVAKLMLDAFSSDKFFSMLRLCLSRVNDEERSFPIWAPKSSVYGSLEFGDLDGATKKTDLIGEEITSSPKFERGTRLLAFVTVREDRNSVLKPTLADLTTLGKIDEASPTYDNTVMVLARKKDDTLELLFLKERGRLKRRLDKRNKREEFGHLLTIKDENMAKKALRKMEEFYRILSISVLWNESSRFTPEQLAQIIDLA